MLSGYDKKQVYEAFLQSMEAAKKQKPSDYFQIKLCKEDRDLMIDYVLQSQTESLNNMPSSLREKIIADETLRTSLQRIISLEPGEGLKFDYNRTGLPRTFYIQSLKKGEIYYIIATDSKLANHTKLVPLKNYSEKRQGGTNVGKPAIVVNKWVNGRELQLFKLVSYNPKISLREIALTEGMDPKYIDVRFLGPQYLSKKDGRIRQILWAERAACSLFEFFRFHHKKITPAIQEKILEGLLKGIQEIHKRKLVHRDLKLDNILLTGDCSAKITDFGDCEKEGGRGVYATRSFQPPEIYYHLRLTTKPGDNDYYFANTQGKLCNSAVRYLSCQSIKEKDLLKAHPLSDIWALGAIMYSVKFLEEPDFNNAKCRLNIKNDPLLKSALAVNRNERGDIDTLLEIFERQKKLKLERAQQDLALFQFKPTPSFTPMLNAKTECADFKDLKNQIIKETSNQSSEIIGRKNNKIRVID